MASNAEAIKEGYEAFGRGDLEAAMELFADDVRWDNPEAPVGPSPGRHEGKDAVQKLLIDTTTIWEEFAIHPDEFIEQGDKVVVLSHAHAKGPGGEAKLPFVHIWQMKDGKAIEVLALTDTALAGQALGTVSF